MQKNVLQKLKLKIRIRIENKLRMLDPELYIMYTDPKPWTVPYKNEKMTIILETGKIFSFPCQS